MSTRLLSISKMDRTHTECVLEYNDGRIESMIFWKYTFKEIFKALRKTCNCTIPKEFYKKVRK